MTKKILFVIPNFSNGGAEKNLIRVINNLDNDLYNIYILCFEKKGENLKDLKAGINIIDINTKRIYFSIIKISQFIKKLQPDIVFSWMGYVNAYLAFFIPFFNKRIKWLCRETSIPSLVNKTQRFHRLFNFLYKHYNNYNLIVCQSQYMANDLIKNFGVKSDKIEIISNGVDFKEINYSISSETINLEIGKFKLLYVGGLRSVKRVEISIRALAALPENYSLTIVGSGDQYNNIIEEIDKYSLHHRVEIVTDCYNPFPYYQTSHCLLLTSLFEGFPNVVVEAFACGCPVIGFNITGGTEELLTNYGGFSLQNKKLEDLAKKIIEVCECENLQRKMIIENCKAKYNIDNMIGIYNSILAN